MKTYNQEETGKEGRKEGRRTMWWNFEEDQRSIIFVSAFCFVFCFGKEQLIGSFAMTKMA
jgi:hypothetical protein